jgi:hypothetical protein
MRRASSPLEEALGVEIPELGPDSNPAQPAPHPPPSPPDVGAQSFPRMDIQISIPERNTTAAESGREGVSRPPSPTRGSEGGATPSHGEYPESQSSSILLTSASTDWFHLPRSSRYSFSGAAVVRLPRARPLRSACEPHAFAPHILRTSTQAKTSPGGEKAAFLAATTPLCASPF